MKAIYIAFLAALLAGPAAAEPTLIKLDTDARTPVPAKTDDERARLYQVKAVSGKDRDTKVSGCETVCSIK